MCLKWVRKFVEKDHLTLWFYPNFDSSLPRLRKNVDIVWNKISLTDCKWLYLVDFECLGGWPIDIKIARHPWYL